MAIRQLRLLLSIFLLALLVGCGTFSVEVETLTDTAVSRTVQYFHGQNEGPVYSFTVTVPEDWVEQFETSTTINRVSFNYVGEGNVSVPVFIVEALAPEQYWEQIGSYPGIYRNISNRNNTYFVYYVPTYFTQSSLSEEAYLELTELVPEIVSTFETEALDEGGI